MQCITQLQLLNPRGGTGLHLVQPLNKLNELSTTLILKLVLVTGQDSLEDGEKLRGQLADGSILPLVHLANHAVQGLILLEVVLQGQNVDQDGEDVLSRYVVAAAKDHTANTASGVVLQTGNVH